MKKLPALERPMFAIFFFFFCLVTDENSESDSDTEEKLKGEKSRCCAGCVLVTGKVRRWRFPAECEGTQLPCRSLLGKAWIFELGPGGPVWP